MSTEQLGLWIAVAALLAQIIQTYIAIRERQAAQGAPVRKGRTPASASGLSRGVMLRLIAFAAIGWAAVLFGYFARGPASIEEATTAENARLDITNIVPIVAEPRQGMFVVNLVVDNKGKLPATNLRHHGKILLADGLLTAKDINPWFEQVAHDGF